jgi:hypothetical protein
MHLFKSIFSILFIAFIFFFVFQNEKHHKEKKYPYYLCQDNHTKEFLLPLTAYQYNNLLVNYTNFTSMYLCNQRQYTRYHVELIKKNK